MPRAFAAHLQPGGVHQRRRQRHLRPRGDRQRVGRADRWQGLLLRWYPDAVDVSGDGKTDFLARAVLDGRRAAPALSRRPFHLTWVRG